VKELRINFSLQRSDSKRAKEEAAVPQLVKTLIPLLNARSLHADYMISGEGNGAWLNADFVSDRSSYLFLTAPGHSHDVARVKDSKWIQVEELCSSAFIRRRWHDTCTGVEGPLGMVFHQVWSVITRCLVASQQQVAVHSSLIQEVLPVPPPPPMPEIDQRTIAQSHELTSQQEDHQSHELAVEQWRAPHAATEKERALQAQRPKAVAKSTPTLGAQKVLQVFAKRRAKFTGPSPRLSSTETHVPGNMEMPNVGQEVYICTIHATRQQTTHIDTTLSIWDVWLGVLV
jgi:hypothetical protein